MINFHEVITELNSRERATLATYIKQIATRSIYIYGAGCFGKELQKVFGQHGVGIKGFLDRNAEACSAAEVPVLYPEQVVDKADVSVIIGIVMNKVERLRLEVRLQSMGFVHILDGQSIRAHYVYAEDVEGEKNPDSYFSQQKEKIESVARLWADEESRITYEKNLLAHLKRDYTSCYQTQSEKQYFSEGIPFTKGFSRFIDCGAYIGDTLQALCVQQGEVESVVAFEPNLKNFLQLTKAYDEKLSHQIKRAVFFPCGVAGKTMGQKISLAGGSSAITNAGEEFVQCIALDDVLKAFAPTFIKMDIEGMEYEALQGAERMIRQYKPDLAISVYHIIDHFYKIPQLLQEWDLGYQFYLRTHSSCCMETVLYAVEGD